MKNKIDVKKLSLSAMFLALAFLMPFLTGQIPQFGAMLCPMHIPVILCGFVCGGPWGLAVGFVAPLLRSFTLGMPPLMTALAMAFELGVYGLASGILYRWLPAKKIYIYVSLVASMVLGRLVWGAVQFLFMGLGATQFGFAKFWAGAVANAIPGIVVQLILIPVIIMALERFGLLPGKTVVRGCNEENRCN
ncbi:MAG: ECF transporter S component [Oscillospiraceae bacterium]|nr:ECF transporter S component [Oscillospiraceae bacterium]